MTTPTHDNLPPILPLGTQVVALVEVKGADGRPAHPAGAVGAIVQSPSDYWHAYRVRFLDGVEASLGRSQLTVLSHYKAAQSGTAATSGGRWRSTGCSNA